MTLVVEKPLTDDSLVPTSLVPTSLAPTLAEVSFPDPPRFVPHSAPRRAGLRDYAFAGLTSLVNTCCGPREKDAFGILLYHRVCIPPADRQAPTWNVTPERFEQQLKGLLARGWQAWPLRQVLCCMERDLPIPRNTFVVTFDDGYANNLIEAAPILAKLHVPATLFLATAYLDSKQPFPSDDWSAAGQPGVPSETWRPLTTEECRRLIGNGLVELGAHTHTHADFRGRPDALRADLAENLAVLQERFDVIEPPFAFPYGTKATGFVSNELAAAAREAGAICSLTTESDIVRRGDTPFGWGRFTAHEFDSAGSLAGKLGGWDTAIRCWGRRTFGRARS